MKLGIIITHLALFLTYSSFAQSNWINYTIENSNLNEPIINCIAIFNDIPYIGTNKTIYKFEDNNWVDMGYNQFIYCLESFDTELLAGTSKGVVAIPSNATNQQYSGVDSPIISDTVISIMKDPKNKIWFGTALGISVYNNGSWGHERKNLSVSDGALGYPVYFKDNTINTLAASASYTYVGSNRGVSRMNYGDVDGFSGASIWDNDWSGLNSNQVKSILVNSDGYQWIGTDEALYFHESNLTKSDWTRYKSEIDLAQLSINSIKTDKNENLFIATTAGLVVYDFSNWIVYQQEDGLVNNYINDIAVDDQNRYWIATSNGVSNFDPTFTAIQNSFAKSQILVYPTILKSDQFLQFRDQTGMKGIVEIYNMSGQIVFSKCTDNFNFSISANTITVFPGYYIIKIQTDSNITVCKIQIH